MGKTLNDLYLKYVNRAVGTLEKDQYFRYLFDVVNAGHNTILQTNQILHKVVDEEWLSTIEDALDSLNKIVEKPRRFIERDEEIVPVSLAKKITADSVRHLSQNTQFITPNEENDEVHPTKILNVTMQETYDLYENRFVYHLIQKLVVFIDKRTDVIFWSTGDEKRDKFTMQSTLKDAYEDIDYKVEMTVKRRQSFAENDSENMDVFMRIDRVRRLVMALRSSGFCSIMKGCALVHSPIQRTNLLRGDPDYRKCYQLWNFLERYDAVGYTIEERNSAIEVDEEYMNQMFTNLITNYTVFKSVLEQDKRNLKELTVKKPKPLKPKFLKTIKEEIVDDYNIEEVEIRKVIIEEVTQAQLDAEAELETTKARLQEVEAALNQADEDLMTARAQAARAMDISIEAERRADEAETAYSEIKVKLDEAEQARDVAQFNFREATAARENAETALSENIAAHKEQIKSLKEAQAERLSKERTAKEEAIKRREEADRKRQAEIERSKERFAAERQSHKEKLNAEISQRKQAVSDAARTKKEALAEAERIKKTAIAEAQKAKKAAIAEAEKAKKAAFAEAEMIKKTALAEAEKIRKRAEADSEKAAKISEKALADLAAEKQAKEEAIAAAKEAMRRSKDDIKTANNALAAKLKAEKLMEEALDARDLAEHQRDEALQKAESRKLGTAIVSLFRGEKED